MTNTETGKLNIELFKKIRQRIAAIPESYDQNTWVRDSARSPCGTVACLAGETIICNAPTVEEGLAELRRLDTALDNWAIPRRAAELLGLQGDVDAVFDDENPDEDDETVMFDGMAVYWPEPFQTMFHEVGQSEAAIAYLDHIISTGKVLE